MSSLARTDTRRPLQLLLGILLFPLSQLLAMGGGLVLAIISGDDLAAGVPSWAQLVGACLGAAAALGGLLLIVGPVGRSPGLTLRGPGALRELLLGCVLGTALITLSTGLIMALGGYDLVGIEPAPQLLTPLAIGIVAAFTEEVLFRGVLLRVLDAWLGSWAALAVSSLLFGLVHLTNPGATLITALGLVIEAGVLLGAAYLLTRRLWLAIGIHFAWNAVQAGVFSSEVSGTGEQVGLLRLEAPGPDWLTGGTMGVEGSVVTVAVGLSAGAVMLVLAHRRGHLLPPVRREAPAYPEGDRSVPAVRSPR